MDKRALVQNTSFGARVAEDESDRLSSYFVETDVWHQVFNGSADVVKGPKGSGKSAIYSLLFDRTDTLFDRNILLAAAENPRGATVFRDLTPDPPASEQEFSYLWKVYLLTLIADVFIEENIKNPKATQVVESLVEEKLIDRAPNRTKAQFLRSAFDYVTSWRPVSSIDGGVTLDTATGVPAFAARISFGEPSALQREQGWISVDSLLATANEALAVEGFRIWILLDRLDVAFADDRDLEAGALRALFRVYNDLAGQDRVDLKVFLRSDIWNRVFEGGFVEASHITKIIEIEWTNDSLVNLIVKRALSNKSIVEYYGCDASKILADIDKQRELFHRVFPPQVEVGAKKPSTLKWMLTRTQDGTRQPAPRELLHLVEEALLGQRKGYDVGEQEPTGEAMIGAAKIKGALAEVSKARLEQTIYAEYPQWKEKIGALEEKRTEQTAATLALEWEVDPVAAARIAQELVQIGVFEEKRKRLHFGSRSCIDLR